jgi:hypothetical protein
LGLNPPIISGLLANISYYSHLLPLLVFFLFLRRNKTTWVKVLLLYVVFSFLVDNLLLFVEHKKYNYYTYHILSAYTIIEYSIFAFYLHSVIQKKLFRIVIVIGTIGFYLFAIYSLFLSTDMGFDSMSASIESILIVAFCILYLFDQLNKPQVIFIYQEPNFWFVVTFLVYLSGTLFLFISASALEKHIRDKLWEINYFANITKNILLAIAFSTKKSEANIHSLEDPFPDIFETPYKT